MSPIRREFDDGFENRLTALGLCQELLNRFLQRQVCLVMVDLQFRNLRKELADGSRIAASKQQCAAAEGLADGQFQTYIQVQACP